MIFPEQESITKDQVRFSQISLPDFFFIFLSNFWPSADIYSTEKYLIHFNKK